MTPDRPLPDWARRERQSDLDWIAENFESFWPTAREAFEAVGRGAIVVDTTSQPTGEGHPFGYLPHEYFEDDEDITRLVAGYDPETEFVIVLLKPDNRTSSYRVKLNRSEGK